VYVAILILESLAPETVQTRLWRRQRSNSH